MCFPLPLSLDFVTAKENARNSDVVMLSALHFLHSIFLLMSRSSKSITALTSDLLEFPFLGELLIQSLQLLNQVSTGSDDGIFGCEGSIGLDAQFKGSEQRVRDFVGGEEDVG